MRQSQSVLRFLLAAFFLWIGISSTTFACSPHNVHKCSHGIDTTSLSNPVKCPNGICVELSTTDPFDPDIHLQVPANAGPYVGSNLDPDGGKGFDKGAPFTNTPGRHVGWEQRTVTFNNGQSTASLTTDVRDGKPNTDDGRVAELINVYDPVTGTYKVAGHNYNNPASPASSGTVVISIATDGKGFVTSHNGQSYYQETSFLAKEGDSTATYEVNYHHNGFDPHASGTTLKGLDMASIAASQTQDHHKTLTPQQPNPALLPTFYFGNDVQKLAQNLDKFVDPTKGEGVHWNFLKNNQEFMMHDYTTRRAAYDLFATSTIQQQKAEIARQEAERRRQAQLARQRAEKQRQQQIAAANIRKQDVAAQQKNPSTYTFGQVGIGTDTSNVVAYASMTDFSIGRVGIGIDTENTILNPAFTPDPSTLYLAKTNEQQKLTLPDGTIINKPQTVEEAIITTTKFGQLLEEGGHYGTEEWFGYLKSQDLASDPNWRAAKDFCPECASYAWAIATEKTDGKGIKEALSDAYVASTPLPLKILDYESTRKMGDLVAEKSYEFCVGAKCGVRAGGLATATFGAAETAGAVGLAFAPDPTFATKAGAVYLAARGPDNFQAGVRTAIFAEETDTLFIDGLEAIGVDHSTAEKIDLGLGLAEGGKGLYDGVKYLYKSSDDIADASSDIIKANDDIGITKPDFYVAPDGTVTASTGYRAIGGEKNVENAKAGILPSKLPDPTYITFDNISNMNSKDIKSLLQLPREPTHVVGFDTLQLNDLSIPTGTWNSTNNLEPITSTMPQYGIGGGTQAITFSPIEINFIKSLENE